jgi:hypothetical protein
VSSKFEDFQFPAVLTLENYVEYFEKTDKVLFDALRVLESLGRSILDNFNTHEKPRPFLAPFRVNKRSEHFANRFAREEVDLSNCSEIIFDLGVKQVPITIIADMNRELTFEKIFGDKNESTDADSEQLMKQCDKFFSALTTMFKILKFFINSYTDIFELKNCFETFRSGRIEIKFDVIKNVYSSSFRNENILLSN